MQWRHFMKPSKILKNLGNFELLELFETEKEAAWLLSNGEILEAYEVLGREKPPGLPNKINATSEAIVRLLKHYEE